MYVACEHKLLKFDWDSELDIQSEGIKNQRASFSAQKESKFTTSVHVWQWEPDFIYQPSIVLGRSQHNDIQGYDSSWEPVSKRAGVLGSMPSIRVAVKAFLLTCKWESIHCCSGLQVILLPCTGLYLFFHIPFTCPVPAPSLLHNYGNLIPQFGHGFSYFWFWVVVCLRLLQSLAVSGQLATTSTIETGCVSAMASLQVDVFLWSGLYEWRIWYRDNYSRIAKSKMQQSMNTLATIYCTDHALHMWYVEIGITTNIPILLALCKTQKLWKKQSGHALLAEKCCCFVLQKPNSWLGQFQEEWSILARITSHCQEVSLP